MRSVRLVSPLAVIAMASLLGTSVGHAITKCAVKMNSKTGVLEVSASDVQGGQLSWGSAPGSESNPVANAATCISGVTAKKCLLGPAGSVEAITPPELCTLYVTDFGAECAAYIKGCTPGKRTLTPEPPPGRQISGFVDYCDVNSGTCDPLLSQKVLDLGNGVSIYGTCNSQTVGLNIVATPVNGCGPSGSSPCNFWVWTSGFAMVSSGNAIQTDTTFFNGNYPGPSPSVPQTGVVAFSGNVATSFRPFDPNFAPGPNGPLWHLDVQAFGRGTGFSCEFTGLYIPASF